MSVLKFKKLHSDAVIPKRANPGDAGLDLVAISAQEESNDTITYKTGLAVVIPDGYVGLIFPRSSIYKTSLILSNCVGVIDSGYRGEIQFKFRCLHTVPDLYVRGDRVGQLVVVPCLQWEAQEVDELSETERGEGGFGSSGK